jgi:nicastrin
MFEHLYPGFESSVLSYITLFSVAEAIGKVKQELSSAALNVLLVLFHGEAFDYIGSSRMVYDIQNKGYNFTLDDIEIFIEIGQLGIHSGDKTVFLHTLGPRVEKFVDMFSNTSQQTGLNMSVVDHTSSDFPPSSFHSFVKAHSSLSGILIANHRRQFANRYYNSMYDKYEFAGLNYDSVNESERYNFIGDMARHIHTVSTTISQTVYKYLVTNNTSAECSPNITTIANMLYCFAVNSSCELLNSTYNDHCASTLGRDKVAQQRYVGVAQSESYDTCHRFLFVRFLGDVINGNWTADTCHQLAQSSNDSIYDYDFIRGDVINSTDSSRRGLCIRSLANISEAQSPAFLIDDYDWSSGEYSTWTESIWPANAMKVRIFMIPSHNQQVTTLLVGISVLILSFVVVYFIERKSSLLFPPIVASSTTTDIAT